MEGFDTLVDKLMSVDGLDREEAEQLAVARLTAGAENDGADGSDPGTPGVRLRGTAVHDPADPPAVSCVCGDSDPKDSEPRDESGYPGIQGLNALARRKQPQPCTASQSSGDCCEGGCE